MPVNINHAILYVLKSTKTNLIYYHVQ